MGARVGRRLGAVVHRHGTGRALHLDGGLVNKATCHILLHCLNKPAAQPTLRSRYFCASGSEQFGRTPSLTDFPSRPAKIPPPTRRSHACTVRAPQRALPLARRHVRDEHGRRPRGRARCAAARPFASLCLPPLTRARRLSRSLLRRGPRRHHQPARRHRVSPMLFKRYPDGSPLSVAPKSGRVRSPGMAGAGPRGLAVNEGALLELEPEIDALTALPGTSLTPPDRPFVGSRCHQQHSGRVLPLRHDALRCWAARERR